MQPKRTLGGGLFRQLLIGSGALGSTLGCFLVLPVIQAIAERGSDTVLLTEADVAQLPPPPPEAPEPEPEPEPEEEEPPPPEMAEQQQPMDLAQLEAALNPGGGDGWTTANFALDLGQAAMDKAMSGDLFDMVGADQPPRVRTRVNPVIDAKLKKRLKKAEARVTLIFFVDEDGRVQNPKVDRTTDPAFNRSALTAISKCRFEPGKSGGQAVTLPAKLTYVYPKK